MNPPVIDQENPAESLDKAEGEPAQQQPQQNNNENGEDTEDDPYGDGNNVQYDF